jgi:hypothetical protein
MIYTVSVSSVLQSEGTKFKPNKNNVWPVVVTSVTSAQLPENSSVIDGSIAESIGLIPGQTYALLIQAQPDRTINGKVYKNYRYAAVGGNITASVGNEVSKIVSASIASMFAPSLVSTPAPTPVVDSTPTPGANDELSEEEEDALLKELQAKKKARLAAAKAEAEADSQSF